MHCVTDDAKAAPSKCIYDCKANCHSMPGLQAVGSCSPNLENARSRCFIAQKLANLHRSACSCRLGSATEPIELTFISEDPT